MGNFRSSVINSIVILKIRHTNVRRISNLRLILSRMALVIQAQKAARHKPINKQGYDSIIDQLAAPEGELTAEAALCTPSLSATEYLHITTQHKNGGDNQ